MVRCNNLYHSRVRSRYITMLILLIGLTYVHRTCPNASNIRTGHSQEGVESEASTLKRFVEGYTETWTHENCKARIVRILISLIKLCNTSLWNRCLTAISHFLFQQQQCIPITSDSHLVATHDKSILKHRSLN